MASKIFVGSLPFSTTNEELEQLFAEFGEIVSAFVVTDRESGRSKGFGFVEFASEDAANAAIEAKNDTEVGGRKIVVNHARPQEQR